MSGTVLITGGSGLVGKPTVAQFASAGWNVVATAHRAAVDGPPGVTIRKTDLTDRAEVERAVSEVAPDVIAHIAAVIPPQIYRDPAAGRRVNVDATESLVRAAEAQPRRPRFLYTSSGSLYGTRNPHRVSDLLTVDTPMAPSEIYGAQKLEAEQIVRSSALEWVTLRIGSVMTVDPADMPFDADTLYFGGALAIDQRIHTIDSRDVAAAFVAAATADVVGEILLVAGDDTHLLRQRELMQSLAAARGLTDLPVGRVGDPETTTRGIRAVTGWTPRALSRRYRFSITHGPTCSPRRASTPAGSTTRRGSSLRWPGQSSSARRCIATPRAAMSTCLIPYGPGSASPRS